MVVTSSAVRPDNPEVLAARRALLPVIPRAEMLAELMRLKYGIAVAGAHGKTTTTSMVAAVLAKGGLDPTVVIGGRLDIWGTNARLGQGPFLVAEADESDGSFLHLSPTIAIVTNLDREHLDFYRDIDHIRETFLAFLNRLPFYGLAILCLDDPHLPALDSSAQEKIPHLRAERPGRPAGPGSQARRGWSPPIAFSAPDGNGVSCNSSSRDSTMFTIPWPPRPWDWNWKSPLKKSGRPLSNWRGYRDGSRSKEPTGGPQFWTTTAITLRKSGPRSNAVRGCWPDRRLIVIFQPHRYSRTQALFEEFTTSFYQADQLIILPIYGAGEDPLEGVNAESLLEAVKAKGHREAVGLSSSGEVPDYIQDRLRPGDILVTLGAGDVWKIGEALVSGQEDPEATGGNLSGSG